MRALKIVICSLIASFMVIGFLSLTASAQNVRPPEDATLNATANVPTEAQGQVNSTTIWQQIRQGATGKVSIPDAKAGQLIQSQGENFRLLRNGPISLYGAYALLGMIVLLAVFFILRGRIRIDGGRSGIAVQRFNGLDRFGHWLMAGSFIILAFSGLNMLFGRHIIMPLIGKEAFASSLMIGKYLHNYVAFAFMAGVALVFLLWVKDNLPSRHDIVWLIKGGGLFSKNTHVPSKRFNAGQKIIFWLVVLLTISVSLSGITLLFPYSTNFMAKTFEFLNIFGFDLPTQLSGLQEQQLSQLWHAIIGLSFTTIIIAHIYIGSVGMEGGFDAMGSGKVDLNWAREHHDMWLDDLVKKDNQKKPLEAGTPQPAE